MSKTLYLGNIPYTATEDEISGIFSAHGEVKEVRIITDRETGRSRGFAFVEIEGNDVTAVIEALDGADYGGRTLRVNEAQERRSRE
ncbi:MAG: RNA-binding protein [Deltaproteobacteria bacterium]|jgi:RNA recognition motif-containing protein